MILCIGAACLKDEKSMRNLFVIGIALLAMFLAGWFTIQRDGDRTTIEIDRKEIRDDARVVIDRGREYLREREEERRRRAEQASEFPPAPAALDTYETDPYQYSPQQTQQYPPQQVYPQPPYYVQPRYVEQYPPQPYAPQPQVPSNPIPQYDTTGTPIYAEPVSPPPRQAEPNSGQFRY